jgi:hypothetical protein
MLVHNFPIMHNNGFMEAACVRESESGARDFSAQA